MLTKKNHTNLAPLPALILVALLTACAAGRDYAGYSGTNPESSPLATASEPSFESSGNPPIETWAIDPAEAEAQKSRRQATVTLGTDQLIKPARAAPQPAIENGGGAVTLNFVDADIRDVVRSILGDILQLNYAVDPDVAGSVTIQTSRPVPKQDLLATLETLLRSNGAALVQQGELYRIVAGGSLARSAAPLKTGSRARGGGAGFGVQVVPLRFAAAGEMAGMLELFAPEGSILKADSSRNLLIIQGTREDRQALLDAVDLFDVDWIKGMSFGMFPLENAKAETLVTELETIFGEGGYAPAGDLLRFVPVERLNAVIAISPRSTYLQRARAWIEQLDQANDRVSKRLHVYYVQNVSASELAKVLSELFGTSAPSTPADPPSPTPAAFSPPPGLYQPDTDTPADGEGIADPLRTPASPAPGAAAPRAAQSLSIGDNGEVRIIAAESSNALLVLASPQSYRMVEQAIRKLDVVPLQVLIEATIAEVTLNDDLRYGVQWFLDAGDNEFSLSEFASGVAGRIFPGFSYLFQSSKDVRLVLNALASVTDVNVISSPQLMVLDNQTAELQVGDEVPIATQSAVSVTDPTAPIVNSIEFRDTGVILRVTPRVNAGGLVIMDIEQEVSSVVRTTTSNIDSPTIQQRKIASSVAVQSGQTVTLGGLISEGRQIISGGLPILSEVPVVGGLFGSKTNSEARTELLVLITPRVVANQLDARKVTEELRSRMRAIEPLRRRVE